MAAQLMLGTDCVTELVEQYRHNAEKCLELAQTSNDPDSKRALLGMANAWLKLAEQRVRNSETPRPNADPSDDAVEC